MSGAYVHRQTGWTTLLILGLAGLLFLPLTGETRIGELGIAILALTAAMFGTLQVSVDSNGLTAAFGIGWPRRHVPWSRVRSYAAVRNRWWYGLGIRLVPNGWLWNNSGLQAVELRLDTGRVFRVGTDEPRALCDAIARHVPDLPRR